MIGLFEVLHATLHAFTAIVTDDAEVSLIGRHVSEPAACDWVSARGAAWVGFVGCFSIRPVVIGCITIGCTLRPSV